MPCYEESTPATSHSQCNGGSNGNGCKQCAAYLVKHQELVHRLEAIPMGTRTTAARRGTTKHEMVKLAQQSCSIHVHHLAKGVKVEAIDKKLDENSTRRPDLVLEIKSEERKIIYVEDLHTGNKPESQSHIRKTRSIKDDPYIQRKLSEGFTLITATATWDDRPLHEYH